MDRANATTSSTIGTKTISAITIGTLASVSARQKGDRSLAWGIAEALGRGQSMDDREHLAPTHAWSAAREFVAKVVRRWIEAVGARTAYIEPGSPWENGFIESFNARLRDELLRP